MKRKLVSIIITTFNSQKTLSLVLRSIKRQTFSQKQIEVIVVDGGSSDGTVAIARKYKAKIIINPRTEQNYGKFLGYLNAKTKYIMFLDSDEVIENKSCLGIRTEAFTSNPNVKAVIGSGYKNPRGYPFINKYINEFGDPFSFFIYRLSKSTSFFMSEMKRRYKVIEETKEYVIFDFSGIGNLPLIELTAGASMIDAEFFKKEFPFLEKRVGLLNHSFHLLLSKFPCLAIAKNDAVIHYSANNISIYLNKISWRVKNNVHFVSSAGLSGFVGRDQFQSQFILRYKKYLFIPYAFSFVLPIVDSIFLAITRRDLRYLFHFPLCLYTASQIIYNFVLKIIGIKPQLLSYGENKPI